MVLTHKFPASKCTPMLYNHQRTFYIRGGEPAPLPTGVSVPLVNSKTEASTSLYLESPHALSAIGLTLPAAETRLISDDHVFIWVKPNSVPTTMNLDGHFINMVRPLSTAAVCLAALLSHTAADTASDLTAALASDPSLSSMQQLVVQHPTLINDLVKDNTAVTIFVPNNDALQAHTATAGRPLTDTPAALLASILAYHVVAAGLISASFNSAKGITAPTLLTGEVYNNRTATPELVAAYGASAGGQVVYAEKDDGGFTIQGGQAERINLTVVDRQWRRGYIQIVDR